MVLPPPPLFLDPPPNPPLVTWHQYKNPQDGCDRDRGCQWLLWPIMTVGDTTGDAKAVNPTIGGGRRVRAVERR